MHALPTERVDLSQLDVVVVQGSRHGQAFVRSMLAGLKVGRIRGYDKAETALHEMRLDPPSIVITDWEMKARSGYWLLTNMRRADMEPLCFVPAVILTSEISWSMLDVALESGVNSVLLKPISALALRRRLEALVEHPQRFVEHEGAYISESAKEVLDERMRSHESPDVKAYRQKLRADLQKKILEDEFPPVEEQSPQPRPEDSEGGTTPPRENWKGWNAA